jgi:dolichyl-phosphate-mannose-protein mannosyltransferase
MFRNLVPRTWRFITSRPEVWVLFGLGLFTRLWGIFQPAFVVFDEVYFKTYALDYLTGKFYFDPHPPLVKLLFGLAAWLMHISPWDYLALPLRIVPAVAGALLIPVFYAFLRRLGASRRIATLGAALVLLDNALLVESRFTLMDSLLLLFGFGALTAWLAARQHNGWAAGAFFILAGLLAGCTAATKWTGLTIPALLGILWLADSIRAKAKRWPNHALRLVALVVPAAFVYVFAFWVHFALLPNSGEGDAFMPRNFQATLVGSPYYDPRVHLSFIDKFIDLNQEMLQSEATLKYVADPAGSAWYTWPLQLGPMYYYWNNAHGVYSYIVLLGNPIIWYGIWVVIAATLAVLLLSGKRRQTLQPHMKVIGFLGIAYFINWLPFSRIERVMFLYHYFFAFLFSLALVVMLLGWHFGWQDAPDVPPWHFKPYRYNWLYITIFGLALAGFIALVPLSYGLPWFGG